MHSLRALLLALTLAAAIAVAAAGATSPGPLGPEGVPIPKGPVFANVQPLHLGEKIDGIPCQTTEKLTYHVHAHLTMFVKGKAYQVPYGIGFGPPLAGIPTKSGAFVQQGSCVAWLHTHASDGIIHMEAPAPRAFALGEFFAIWGLPLSSTRVGPYKGGVTVYYDGKVWKGDPNKVPLTNHTEVQIDVGSPVVAPEHIAFPKALGASTGK